MMKNNIKRLIPIIMAVTMIFAMCACAAAEPNESDKKDSEVASEVTETEKKEAESEVKEDATEAEEEKKEETTDEEVNEYGFTESQMQELYDSIALSVKTEYLEPNDINPEEFEWPDYEDLQWSYLKALAMDYWKCALDNSLDIDTLHKSTKMEFTAFFDTENNVMNIVFNVLIDFYSKESTNSEAYFYTTFFDSNVKIEELIIQNVDFSKTN